MAETSPVREVLEARFSQLLSELEGVVDSEIGSRLSVQVEGRLGEAVTRAAAEAEERSRREFASQLNQAVRRLRQASDVEALVATLLDVASSFSRGAALMSVHEDSARGERVRGVSEEAAEAFRGSEIHLEGAPALVEAIHGLDPVTAAATPAQVSAEAARLAAQAGDGRLSIFPLVVSAHARALLLAWGAVEASALEMLTHVAAACWSALPGNLWQKSFSGRGSVESLPLSSPEFSSFAASRVLPRAASASPVLVKIAIPENARAQSRPDPGAAWDTLSHKEQQTHLRAQRFARVQVAEMRLFEPEAVQEGRAQRDLYGKLRKPMDAARLTFHESFFATCPSMVDYLHLELVKTLAHNETELLGNDYPGPMV